MKLISILLTLTCLFSQKVKDYTIKLDDLSQSNIKLIAPKGSNLSVTTSKNDKFIIKMRIEVPDKFEEFFNTLPEKPSVYKKIGSNVEIDFDFVLKALSKESNSFFGKLFSSIKGDGDMIINGTRYFSEDGKRYEVISHFISMEIEAPETSSFFLKHRYGKLVVEGIKSNILKLDSYESDLAIKKITGDIIVQNKYNLTHISDISGDASVVLYESPSEVFNISGNLEFENKYKESAISNIMKSADIKLYSSDATIEKISGTLDIENKYATTKIQSVKGNIKSKFYESPTRLFDVSGDVNFENKYDESILKNISGNLDISLYESSTTISDIDGNISGSAKYDPINISRAKGDIKLELYESKTRIESSGNINLKAKYDDIEISGDPKSIEIDAYSATSNIILSPSFSSNIEINSKYGHVKIDNMDIKNFRIKAKAKNGRIDIKDLELDEDEKVLRYQWYKKDLILMDIETYDGNIIVR